MSTPRQHEDAAEESRRLERDVHAAARRLGWVIPTSEEDVRRAERELAMHPLPLPEKLRNPQAVWDLRVEEVAAELTIARLPPSTRVILDLARAAREGGQIPEDVNEQMRRDREAAERDGRHDPESAEADGEDRRA